MSDVSITDLIAEARTAARLSAFRMESSFGVLHRLADALESVTAPTEDDEYQGLASAMLLMREQQFHFPADSIASAIDELKRLRSLAAEVDEWSESVEGEDLVRLLSEAENFSGEDRGEMLDLIPRLAAAVKSSFRPPVTAPTEPEYEYRRRRSFGVQPNATFDSMPMLDEGEWAQRRILGEWENSK